ncbi:MAG: hypothetical protein CV089_00645 [Nitrospira sp. WS110]|nr:hypothetical protein [Nitrospira sp. WS110]
MQKQNKGTIGRLMASAIISGALVLGAASLSLAKQDSGHHRFKGEVIEKAGSMAVKSENGTTYQLSENEARRQGREFKPGDKVNVTVNENNAIVDIHLEGQKGKHTFVTGKLIHVGQMKKDIKLQTAEGDRSFPLLLQETKTKGIPEGTEVTVELNEAGTVVDLHKGKQ